MKLEGVLLTGGASRRMGRDKASLEIEGELLSHRLARILSKVCDRVTILGREPVEGFDFLPDSEEFAGPLAALGAFQPMAERVFVASCDLPGLDSETISKLAGIPGEAVVPIVEGRLQPLCAVYSAHTFEAARQFVRKGEKRVLTWLAELSVVQVEIADLDLPPERFMNVNSPDDWQRASRPSCD